MRSDMSANVAAFEQTLRATIALAETFGPADWARPTDCPGWSVQDVVSHLVSVEALLLGVDPAPGHLLPEELPHVRNDMGRMMEVGVDARRSRPGAEVLGELREVLDRRLAALPEIDPEQPTLAPTGRMVTYAEFMVYRAFDCWVHEQDIRRAVGRPGNLGTPGADCARRIMQPGLPRIVAKRAGAVPGQAVLFEITGPLSFTARVEVDDEGKGRFADGAGTPGAPGTPDAPDATLRMDWETFMRLVAGRCGPADVKVDTEGDPELARRILANMALTP